MIHGIIEDEPCRVSSHKTWQNEDSFIVVCAKRYWNSTAVQWPDHSKRHDFNLRSRSPPHCQPMNIVGRQKRIQRTRTHENWLLPVIIEWRNCLLSIGNTPCPCYSQQPDESLQSPWQNVIKDIPVFGSSNMVT